MTGSLSDLMLRGPLDSFADLLPRKWSEMSGTTLLVGRPAKRRRGIDWFKFLTMAASFSGAALAVDQATAWTGQMRFVAELRPIGHTASFRNDLLSAGSARAKFSLREVAATNGTFVQDRPRVRVSFPATDHERARIDEIGTALRGVGNMFAYKGDENDLILEAGEIGRTLTFFIRPDEIVAMYRSGRGYDVSSLREVTLPAHPGSAAILQLAREYKDALAA